MTNKSVPFLGHIKLKTVGLFFTIAFAISSLALEVPENAQVPAKRVVDQLSRLYIVEELDLDIGASIGLSIFPRDDTLADELIRKADFAMYRAKESLNEENN